MAGKGNPAKTAENRYKTKRREMGWSREAAAFELHMSDDKLERIENGKQRPTPKDVLDALTADAHVERRCVVVGIPVEGQVRIVPKVGDRVAKEDHVELLALAAADVGVEMLRLVVARVLFWRARIRGMVGARNLAADFDAERNERRSRYDGSKN